MTVTVGASLIIRNKVLHDAPHFTSWHGKLGILTLGLIIVQNFLGLLMAGDAGWGILGGEHRAKALWKYHR